jgi:hypothetical protein
MASSTSLVAPPMISRRAGLSRVLASVLCIIAVVFVSGYHSRAHSLFPKSLLLRDGIPNDREIEFESSVCHFLFVITGLRDGHLFLTLRLGCASARS